MVGENYWHDLAIHLSIFRQVPA